MKDKDFNRLVEGVKQFVQIKRGEMKPSRVFEFTALDVKALRESLHKSQSEFARMIGVSLSTLQNWEQGPPPTRRHRPRPPPRRRIPSRSGAGGAIPMIPIHRQPRSRPGSLSGAVAGASRARPFAGRPWPSML